MNHSQKKRYDKLFTEPFYLLNTSYENDTYIFYMSGSKQDVYTVTIYNDANSSQGLGEIICNCPDMSSWAKRQHVVCKHCCFILFKVLKCFTINSNKVYINDGHNIIVTDFFNQLWLVQTELDLVGKRFEKITLTNNEYTNDKLITKYNKLMGDVDSGKVVLTFEGKDNTKTISPEDECPICSCELLDDKNAIDKLLACPICHTYIHKECMHIWINHCHNTCVYCRSDIWKRYFCPLLQNKPKISTQDYKNLNDVI
mgnify:CR=1 FL=1